MLYNGIRVLAYLTTITFCPLTAPPDAALLQKISATRHYMLISSGSPTACVGQWESL